jgi:hypothetical protein
VLKHQFATVPRDLAVQVSRVLGIQATRDDAAARIEAIIERLVGKGVFEKMASGLVRIPEGSGVRIFRGDCRSWVSFASRSTCA